MEKARVDLVWDGFFDVFPAPNPPRYQTRDTGGGDRIDRKDNQLGVVLPKTHSLDIAKQNIWSIIGYAEKRMGNDRNAVYNTGYHFKWSVKYRRQVLRALIDQTVKERLAAICQGKGWLGMEGMPRHVCRDHIHIFVSGPPKISQAAIARFLRGSSARYWFQRHPELKRWRWGEQTCLRQVRLPQRSCR